MKLSDSVLEAMLTAGLVTGFGGTREEVLRIIATVGQCDEATVILRRAGEDVAVLVIADDCVEGASTRGEDLAKSLS